MSQYGISQVYASDKFTNKQIDKLLNEEGIRRDANLDYTCAMYDDNMDIIATGSCFGNTLRCMAVNHLHQGEGLMNEIVTHLVDMQIAHGNSHLFLYTKLDSSKFFQSLGFYPISTIKNHLVFMENKRTGFKDYLKKLQNEASSFDCLIKKDNPKIASIVMNANPFTLGHQYLVEKACRENDLVHLFIVSEDASLVPFSIRKKLVKNGTAHLNNLCIHDSGPYIISNATFPSYFQKNEKSVIEGHALLDLYIFTQIADSLKISKRYVGNEPNSFVTNIYNQFMNEELPNHGIQCTIVPRIEFGGKAISASTVRQAIKDSDWSILESLLPPTTLEFFKSEDALSVIDAIKKEENVIHY